MMQRLEDQKKMEINRRKKFRQLKKQIPATRQEGPFASIDTAAEHDLSSNRRRLKNQPFDRSQIFSHWNANRLHRSRAGMD